MHEFDITKMIVAGFLGVATNVAITSEMLDRLEKANLCDTQGGK